MYRSIVVPLDGSPFGEHALPLALNIARRSGAALHLVHVHMAAPMLTIDAIPIHDETLDDQIRTNEQTYLDELAHKVAANGLPTITTALIDGLPVAGVVLDYAQRKAADLIVMTSHGRGPFSRLWLGSTADTLVRRATLPTLLVRPGAGAPNFDTIPDFKRILVPLDGSVLSEQIISYAIALGSLSNAEYVLLRTVEPTMSSYGPGMDLATEQVIGQLESNARTYLEEVAARMSAESLRVKTDVVIGSPALHVLDYARDFHVDLIAMQTHGRSGLSRFLLGSVTDKVLRGASVPVLLHRPKGVEHAH